MQGKCHHHAILGMSGRHLIHQISSLIRKCISNRKDTEHLLLSICALKDIDRLQTVRMPANERIYAKITQLLRNFPLLLRLLQLILRPPVKVDHDKPCALLFHVPDPFISLRIKIIQRIVVKRINQSHIIRADRNTIDIHATALCLIYIVQEADLYAIHICKVIRFIIGCLAHAGIGDLIFFIDLHRPMKGRRKSIVYMICCQHLQVYAAVPHIFHNRIRRFKIRITGIIRSR